MGCLSRRELTLFYDMRSIVEHTLTERDDLITGRKTIEDLDPRAIGDSDLNGPETRYPIVDHVDL